MLYEFFNFQCDACIAVNYADAVLHKFVKCQCVTCIAVNHADVVFLFNPIALLIVLLLIILI